MKAWSIRLYPRFRRLLAEFESYLEDAGADAVRIFSGAYDAISLLDSSDDAQLLRAAYFFAEIYSTAGSGKVKDGVSDCFSLADCSNGNPRLSLSSRLTYLRCFPKALYYIRHQKRALRGPLAEAQRILLASGLFRMRTNIVKPQSIKGRAARCKLEASPSMKLQKLYWPQEVELLFGLDQPLPSKQEFSVDQMNTLAQRVMTIVLVRCFQRFRSFVRFAVDDIIRGETTTEVLIVQSKSGRIMQRIPLEPLCARSEVQFVSDFRQYVEQLGIDRETALTELAGLGRLRERGAKAR